MSGLAWMEDARQIAAQCWCDEETRGIEMDSRLCEAFAIRLSMWMGKAAEERRNAEFYRSLLDDTAKHLGKDVFIAYDGTVMTDPIRLKIPEMVAALARREH